ncbi:hypothetical protein ABEV54_09040 [Peribacillus psychrosaccharolyticus]
MSHQKKKSSKPNEKEKDTLFLKAKPEKFNEPNPQNEKIESESPSVRGG